MSVSLERLQALRRQSGGPKPASVAVPVDPVLDQVAKLRGLLRVKRSSAPRIVQSTDRDIPGVELVPGLWFREQVLPLDVSWPQALDGTFARSEPIPSADLLFFDTETTGLAGGTGTRAFMVGAADVTPAGLRVRQLTIANTAAEPAMLETFQTWLSPSTILCSYNGRSYDAPLLKTRYRLMRQQEPLSGLAHVDLLYPTRRRYRGVFENCRLATIERRVLGIVREDDLPGSEAPGAWLGYLRGGSSQLLKRVLAHNHQDVVTLARLALHLEVQPCSP
ncbi:MAG: exonuclease [Alphaproteobacteria bacterium]|nr:MAG: exonuclease [Alphaproteobacteria bacterium]